MGPNTPEMPTPEADNGGEKKSFDSDFDAGVEANEEDDPKKYIQQLTGKLSQSLRNYNSELPEADADLNKYVAGMIVKQAIEGLSEKDRNEILKKVSKDDKEAGEDGPTLDDVDGGEDDPDMGENMPQQDMPAPDDNQMGESVNRRDFINELFQDIIAKKDAKSQRKPQRKDSKGYRNRPY